MTEHNRIPARQIIVYGDCWPVTIAVAHPGPEIYAGLQL